MTAASPAHVRTFDEARAVLALAPAGQAQPAAPAFTPAAPPAPVTPTNPSPVAVVLTIDPSIDAPLVRPESMPDDGVAPPPPTARVRSGTAVRPGTRADVPAVRRVVAHWARAGENLPRTDAELLAAADAGLLAVAVREGTVVACAILAPYDGVLAEIRSVGVDPRRQGGGAGSAVVRHLVAAAALRGLRTVFVLTRAPSFFDRLGFARTTIDTLPDKIRRDCIRCPRIDRCDEIAMVRPLTAGPGGPWTSFR